MKSRAGRASTVSGFLSVVAMRFSDCTGSSRLRRPLFSFRPVTASSRPDDVIELRFLRRRTLGQAEQIGLLENARDGVDRLGRRDLIFRGDAELLQPARAHEHAT